MPKRHAEDRRGGQMKKQKRDLAQETEKIESSRQLQHLFSDYANVGNVQHGVQSLKEFLASCQGDNAVEKNLEILLEYLESQSSSEESCKDLLLAWSYAGQSNNFQLLSTIPTVLVILLQTISPSPIFRKHGLALSKSLLQQAYLKIFYRSLTGNRDAITAPCLRLLTEINRFDNGSLCALLQQSFDFTVKDIAKNLEVKKKEATVDDPGRPTVRTTFIRFILSFIEYGTVAVKTEILGLRSFITPLFKYIKLDSALALKELFLAFQKIIADASLPRNVKSTLFNEWVLSRIADLYSREDVAEIMHAFLKELCTVHGSGVCFKDAGWNAGEDRKGRVYNRALSGLLPHIRPYADTLQQELVVEIFRACPELVADYFANNTSFSFDPKLTSTWIGFASFLSATVELPLPTLNLPPANVVIENILPRPITKVVLTKCLSHETYLVKFITTRLLNAAFTKLSSVLTAIDDASAGLIDSAWDLLRFDVVEEFCKRAPDMAIVIKLFSSMPENGSLHREAVTRLLKNYFEVLPEVASGHTLDLTGVLGKFLSTDWASSSGFSLLELKNTLSAVRDNEIKWWNKGSLPYTPFIAMLKLYINAPSAVPLSEIYDLLISVAGPSQIFQTETAVPPFEALVQSLKKFKETTAFESILHFLDDCCQRCMRSPYKYFDEFAALAQSTAAKDAEYVKPLSPLLLTLVEQWSFYVSSHAECESAGLWLSHLFESSCLIGENELVLEELSSQLGTGPGYETTFANLNAALTKWRTWNVDVLPEKAVGIRDSICSAQVALPSPNAEDASLLSIRCAQMMIIAVWKSGEVNLIGLLSEMLRMAVNEVGSEALPLVTEAWWLGYLFDASSLEEKDLKRNVILYNVILGSLHLVSPDEYNIKDSKTLSQFLTFFGAISERFDTNDLPTRNGFVRSEIVVRLFETVRLFIHILDLNGVMKVWQTMRTMFVNAFVLHMTELCWSRIRKLGGQIPTDEVEALLPLAPDSISLCHDLLTYVKTNEIVLQEGQYQLVRKLFDGQHAFDKAGCRILALELLFKLPNATEVALDMCSEDSKTKSSELFTGILSRLTDQDEKTRLYSWKDGVDKTVKERFGAIFKKLRIASEARKEPPMRAFDNDIRDGCLVLEYAASLYPDYSKAISAFPYPVDANERARYFSPISTVNLIEVIYQVSGIDEKVLAEYCSSQISRMTHQMESYRTNSHPSVNHPIAGVKRFGEFVQRQKLPIFNLVHFSIINAYLEAAFTHSEYLPEIIYLAAVLIAQSEYKNIEYSRFLQQILASKACPLRSRDASMGMNRQLAAIIKKLFNFAKIAQSNITTLDGVLLLYQGTNDAVDTTLLEIIVFIEGHLARSCATRISTWMLTDEENDLVMRDNNGRMTLSLNSKMVTGSIKNINKVATEKLELDTTLEPLLDEESAGYDLGFFLPIITFCMITGEQAFDLQPLLEKQCVGLAITGLCSPSGEVRGMAESFLTALVAKLETSTYRERSQVLQLLCTILASLNEGDFNIKTHPIPALTGNFLASCLQVLCNPGHFLYDKMMTFLLRRPYLNLHDIPLIQPLLSSEDDFNKDATWILTVLTSGVKDAQDLTIFHKNRVFEQIMSVYTTPFANERIREKVIELLWTVAKVEGGASTLITRHGVLAWVAQRLVLVKEVEEREKEKEKEKVQLKRLAARLYEGSAKEHVKKWSSGNVGRVLERIVVM